MNMVPWMEKIRARFKSTRVQFALAVFGGLMYLTDSYYEAIPEDERVLVVGSCVFALCVAGAILGAAVVIGWSIRPDDGDVA